jgi:hypothetical protein
LASSSNNNIKVKNWLIRTKNRQILGPVSKEKLLEFVKKGALSLHDEVTSGNGYWFYINEKELVDKYLFGDVPQGFNPISEAPSVLSVQKNSEHTGTINPGLSAHKSTPHQKLSTKSQEETALPSADDLSYPDLDNFEFPETTRIDDDKAPDSTQIVKLQQEVKRAPVKTKERVVSHSIDSDEEASLPSDEDLEYPE